MSLPLFGIGPVSTIRSYSTDNLYFVLTCQNELDKVRSNQRKGVFMTNLRRLRLILPILLSLCAGLSWADDYPRTPGLDVLHYTFRLELSDATDEIIGETTVVVRFVSEGGTDFHLDLQYVDDYQGTSIQTWVFPRDRDAGFYDFARAKRPLAFFSSYIGPYSYEKLANVQVTAPVGATEAATSIFYQQDFVTGDRGRENTITHEIAHHWFGNAVTEDDWDHVWLSEGFATYFTLLFIEYAYGRDRFVEGLKRSRERVFEFYKDNPDYRIVHDNLTDMSKVTTRNTYQKGAWVLHMLRGLMGDESFWAGFREYYRRFRDRNASTQDFRQVMEEFSADDLSWFFQQWLYQGGKLEYRGRWSYDREQKQLELELDQVQTDGTSFRMPVEIGIYGAGEPQIERLQVDERKNRFNDRAGGAAHHRGARSQHLGPHGIGARKKISGCYSARTESRDSHSRRTHKRAGRFCVGQGKGPFHPPRSKEALE